MAALIAVGVDVGQRVDPTAIAVLEHERRPRDGADPEEHYTCRHLERLALGTSYPKVAERVAALARSIRERTGHAPSTVYLDATGVGTPVCDLLRAALEDGRLVPVFFTHGDQRVTRPSPSFGVEVSLGKAWLVSRLQALLQSQRLHLPRTAEAEVLAKELLDYEIKVDQDANDRYGAFKVGTHDDLVTALGLAVQPLHPPVRSFRPL